MTEFDDVALKPFTRRVLQLIVAIPEGRVATYGDIAAAAGSPRASRQVVRVLHSMSRKYGLPWHRVVNKSGAIALSDSASFERQLSLLLMEGVEVKESGQIAGFDACRWLPLLSEPG